MDYEGYTFVFFYQNINKIFSLKCDIYYALTFQKKRSGGSSVNDICLNKIKFLKLLPSFKSVNPLQRSYHKGCFRVFI